MSSASKTPTDPVAPRHQETPIEAAEAVVRRDIGYARELLAFLGAVLGGLRALWPQGKPKAKPVPSPTIERIEETAEKVVERIGPYPIND